MKRTCDASGAACVRLVFCLLAICTASTLVGAQDVCEFYLNSCPRGFDGDTIHVPAQVVAMASKVHGCQADSTASDSNSAPSIVFVIDNSGSMSGATGTQHHDQWGSRYTVVRDLLDTIARLRSDAEVGVVVFREYLYFDTASTQPYAQYFRAMPRVYDNHPSQAYLPLLQLNQTYGGTSGINIIKQVLATDTVPATAGTLAYVNLTYTPLFSTTGSTNINIAMLAARQALAQTQRPKNRQFVIFLSDGEPQGTNQAGLASDYFALGDSIATTFTVFFTDSGVNTAPAILDSMTRHIQTNGYSSANPESQLWAMQTSHDALLSLITGKVMGTILAGSPSGMIVSALTAIDTATSYVNGYFVFTERFPLQKDLTPFQIPLMYRYTEQATGATHDTTIDVHFFVEREPGTTPQPAGVEYACWTRSLQIAYGGSPVSQVTNTMEPLEVRLVTTDAQATPAGVTLSSATDTESVTLTHTGQYWSGSFTTSAGAAGVPRNGKLEIRNGDSIVAVYRNPKLPLDTIRIAVPFVDRSGPAISKAMFVPAAAGTQGDTLRLSFNEPINCQLLTSASPESVFVYFAGSVQNTDILSGATFAGSCQQTKYISDVSVVLHNSQFAVRAMADSIAFVSQSSRVADSLGRVPSEIVAKRVIEFRQGGEMDLAASSNPVSLRDPIDPKIRQAYANVVGNEQYGAVISVYSPVPLRQITVNGVAAYGKADIYNAVANLVQTNLPVMAAGQPGVYGVFWSLRNRNSRVVGNGTYLVKIAATDIAANKFNRRIMIGVRR